MGKERKVFITGAGVISPFGEGKEKYWQSMLENREFLPHVTVDTLKEKVANRLSYTCNETEREFISDKFQNLLGNISRFAIEAAEMAIADAQIEDLNLIKNAGVSIGTATGDEDLCDESRSNNIELNGLEEFPFRAASTLSSHFGLNGPNLTISTACTSSSYAIDLGIQAINQGSTDMVIAGGSESSSKTAMACFNRLGALDPEKCRPFDANRQGTVLGSGAVLFVLESEASINKRGHEHIYGEILGSGWSCDGHDVTAPEPSGEQIERCMRAALRNAQLEPEDIDCIIPHGTGTPLNDELELRIMQKIFKKKIEEIFLCAIKSKIGHSGGASGAFSLLTGCLILENGLIPANSNLEKPDPICEFNLHVGDPINFDVKKILINVYGFGGSNISFVLGK